MLTEALIPSPTRDNIPANLSPIREAYASIPSPIMFTSYEATGKKETDAATPSPTREEDALIPSPIR